MDVEQLSVEEVLEDLAAIIEDLKWNLVGAREAEDEPDVAISEERIASLSHAIAIIKAAKEAESAITQMRGTLKDRLSSKADEQVSALLSLLSPVEQKKEA